MANGARDDDKAQTPTGAQPSRMKPGARRAATTAGAAEQGAWTHGTEGTQRGQAPWQTSGPEVDAERRPADGDYAPEDCRTPRIRSRRSGMSKHPRGVVGGAGAQREGPAGDRDDRRTTKARRRLQRAGPKGTVRSVSPHRPSSTAAANASESPRAASGYYGE